MLPQPSIQNRHKNAHRNTLASSEDIRVSVSSVVCVHHLQTKAQTRSTYPQALYTYALIHNKQTRRLSRDSRHLTAGPRCQPPLAAVSSLSSSHNIPCLVLEYALCMLLLRPTLLLHASALSLFPSLRSCPFLLLLQKEVSYALAIHYPLRYTLSIPLDLLHILAMPPPTSLCSCYVLIFLLNVGLRPSPFPYTRTHHYMFMLYPNTLSFCYVTYAFIMLLPCPFLCYAPTMYLSLPLTSPLPPPYALPPTPIPCSFTPPSPTLPIPSPRLLPGLPPCN